MYVYIYIYTHTYTYIYIHTYIAAPQSSPISGCSLLRVGLG